MLKTDFPISFASKQSGSRNSSPDKQNLSTFDFSAILNSEDSIRSKNSTNDTFSIITDDETTKSLLNFEAFSCETPRVKSRAEPISPQKQTLKEIISKRVYFKLPKERKLALKNEYEITQKRRSSTKIEYFEHILKKEKREDGQIVLKSGSIETPQIVMKDGRVEVNMKFEEDVLTSLPLEKTFVTSRKLTTSKSFKKEAQTEKWSEKETKKFFRALELFGTDFSTIGKLFKNRNHNQIKNKFLKEEKMSPEKIDAIFKKSNKNHLAILICQYQAKILNNSINSKEQGAAPPYSEPFKGIDNQSNRQGHPENTSEEEIDNIDLDIMEDLADIFLPLSGKRL